MIEIQIQPRPRPRQQPRSRPRPDSLPDLARWFPTGAPGPAALAEHVLRTGAGQWWADRAVEPRAVAVSCADHALLRGDPRALAPGSLAPLTGSYIEAPVCFLPVLGASFRRIVPGERMVYVHRAPATAPTQRPPQGVTVRRLVAEDAGALAALGPAAAWLYAGWNGPSGLAASGLGQAAFHRDRILAVACTYFLGSAYEDVACFTVPEHRRRRLAHACVAELCADIAARGRTASWSCSRGNRPSRLLAWTSGFRLEREYVHYATRETTVSRLARAGVPA